MDGFSCWSEADNGCNVIHKDVYEAGSCMSLEHKSIILQIEENDMFLFWITKPLAGIYPIVIKSKEVKINENETNYLIDIGLI